MKGSYTVKCTTAFTHRYPRARHTYGRGRLHKSRSLGRLIDGGQEVLKYTIEIVGWVAAALMLSAYVLLTRGRISGRSRIYHWLNVLSGAGFVVNSGWNGAYPSAVINVVWMLIGFYGLFGRPVSQSASE